MKFSDIPKTHSSQHGYEDEMGAPDWPPAASASSYQEGHKQRGSTGQLFEVKKSQWVRVKEDDPRLPGGKFYPA
jgi:hypothetical protein